MAVLPRLALAWARAFWEPRLRGPSLLLLLPLLLLPVLLPVLPTVLAAGAGQRRSTGPRNPS